MKTWAKILLIESWFFFFLPILAVAFSISMGRIGDFLFLNLVAFWMWMLFTHAQYRHCRQEEFLYLLQTAAATQAPIESVLRAYLNDRPREHVYRGVLLFFVFPGYYWLHLKRSFDHRLSRLLAMLESGLSLDQALRFVPGVASREVAQAVTVGQFSGKLRQTLTTLTERRQPSPWLDLFPRFVYPVFLVFNLMVILTFVMVFIIPKFETIFLHFKMRLPYETELLIAISRWAVKYWYVAAFWWLLGLLVFNMLLFSSTVRWHFPLFGRLYRMHAQGEFLRTLGLMLETEKPLPMILDRVLEAGTLPSVMAKRVDRLAVDLEQGVSLEESLAKHRLLPGSARGLVAAAEKAKNLPWAIREIGDALTRRCARLSHRWTMVLFPLTIFGIACVIGLVAVSMFSPLVALIEGVSRVK